MVNLSHHKMRTLALLLCLCGLAGIVVDIDHLFMQSRAWHFYFAIVGIGLLIAGSWHLFSYLSRHLKLRFLGLALIMLLGLYPIAELTRVILISGYAYYPNMNVQFIVEIIIMWLLYLAIIPVFLFTSRRAK